MAKSKSKSEPAAQESGIRLSAHPRARRQIAMAKGWGGLGAFAGVLYLSLQAGLPTADALLRGVAGGLVGYVVAWMIAVTVWRQVALAELERLRRSMLERLAASPPQAQGGESPEPVAQP